RPFVLLEGTDKPPGSLNNLISIDVESNVVFNGFLIFFSLPLLAGNAMNDKTEGKRKGRPKTENQALKDIPLPLMNQWKDEFKAHSRVKCPNLGCWLEFPSIYGLKYHFQRCQGVRKSAQLSSFSDHLHCNSVVLDLRQQPGPGFLLLPAVLRLASRPKPLTLPLAFSAFYFCFLLFELGRKQKTPKKFTGEQPSISGTFGLKGLAKAEDKAKAHRAKKLEASLLSGNTEDHKKKHAGSNAKKEATALATAPSTTATPEEQWQRIINEKGEVACPTCGMITRKTVLGLKKHMEVCQKLQDALKCQHCKKQFKSKAGLNYHTMAEHTAPVEAAVPLSELGDRERLRKMLKQMGKLKCPNEGCVATFSSLMGYQYHQKRCGKQPSELEKPVFTCPHCGKAYKSKAGHDYHVRSEHPATPPEQPELQPEPSPVEDFERTPSGRIRRTSAQVAVFHLQEIAEDELAKDWTKRRMKDDLVPETKQLNYTRPGLPKLNPRLLEAWKNEVKEKGHINCPNDCCAAIYCSVSGLKAHLANCNKGGHSVGKYRCLLCQKEFSSESGVKYHIIKTHSENWFHTSTDSSKKKKSKEPRTPSNEEQKTSPDGKKRGRKPKERPSEFFPKDTESLLGNINHKKRGNKPFHAPKFGASKMPEK
uniref:Zinc finger protein 512B n=1 Tax=Pseudonaja textilis TaxID=8673 RepID=A0A670Z797_PSETE